MPTEEPQNTAMVRESAGKEGILREELISGLCCKGGLAAGDCGMAPGFVNRMGTVIARVGG